MMVKDKVSGMIRFLVKGENWILAEYVYQISYSKDKGEFSCTCPAGINNKKCRHIAELRRQMEEEGIIPKFEEAIKQKKLASPA